jgi:type I restriction enzyme S subunit
MEMVKTGYKQTEIGVIPEDWEILQIRDIVENGKIPSGIYKDIKLYGKGTKIIKLGDVFRYDNFIPELAQKVKLNQKEVQTYKIIIGDIIVALASVKLEGVGKVMLVDKLSEDTVYDHNVALMRLKSDYSNKFVSNLFKSNIVRKSIASKATQVGTTFLKSSSLLNILVPLPPLPEQQAIAEALSDADTWIESLEQLIAKKRQLKQGAMQVLLTPKEDWEVKKLGDYSFITKLAGFEYSLHFNSYKDEGDIIVVRGTNITKNKLDLSDVKTIPTKTSNNLLRSKLYKNDLVFAYVGTIGPIYLIEEDNRFHLGPNTAKISVNYELNSMFLFHYFTSSFIKDEIKEHTSIGAQPSLSMSKIRSFKINLPCISEQTRIATILSDMDLELEALQQQLEKARQIKQGMMQDLLTGRIRLV